MKYFFAVILLCVTAMSGCKAPQFYMGENEEDFVRHNRVQMVEATGRVSIYKKVNYPFGSPAVTKFFYFTDGKLTQVNEGERIPDIIVENRHSN